MPDLATATTLSLKSEDEMTRFGRRVAGHLKRGDTVLLSGPIGAGKTHLARSIIRALTGLKEEIPSPTYTLVQTYESAEMSIWHVDLYRLADSSELIELGLDEAIGDAVVLIEWPDRMPEELRPADALEISITPVGDARKLKLDASAKRWAAALEDLANG